MINRIIIFVLVNLLGFSSAALVYGLAIKTGKVPMDPPEALDQFLSYLVYGTIMTWMVCAVFSFGYFFFKGKTKLFFLWAPVVIPFCYGLKVVYF